MNKQCYRFLYRHNLFKRIVSYLGELIKANINDNIQDYSLIINVDEKTFYLYQPLSNNITNKGTQDIIIDAYSKEKVRVSVVLAIAADGSGLKPLLLCKGKKNEKIC